MGYWFVSISTHTISPCRGQLASEAFAAVREMNLHGLLHETRAQQQKPAVQPARLRRTYAREGGGHRPIPVRCGLTTGFGGWPSAAA
jgi:hypothetical protein